MLVKSLGPKQLSYSTLCWLIACLLLILGACSSNKLAKEPIPTDHSRPNLASIYFYLSASVLHYNGDYLSAGELYKRALEQDPSSYQIQKQILLNSAYAYMSKQQDAELTSQEFSEAKQIIRKDVDLLNAAYSVYNEAADSAEVDWAVNELISSFPSTRAYLQKFYNDHLTKGRCDEQNLRSAYKYANGKPDELVMVARIYTLVNPQRSVEILSEAVKLDPKPDNMMLHSEFLIKYGNLVQAVSQFQGFRYPQDKSLMLNYLQTANKLQAFDAILQVSDYVLATGDAILITELAFAAYLRSDDRTLLDIYSALQTKYPEPESDARIATFLVAQTIVSDAHRTAARYLDYLYGVQDADDIIFYHTLKQSLGSPADTQQALPEFSPDLKQRIDSQYSGTLWGDYLSAAVVAKEVADSTLATARTALCESLYEQGRGYDSDYTVLLNHYHATGQFGKKPALLRTAINKFPNNPLYLNDLGYSLLEYPDSLELAGRLISQAIVLEPDNPYYQDSMAWYYYLLKDYPKALEHLSLPMQMESIPGEIAYHIGAIMSASEMPEEAGKFLRMAEEDTQAPEYQEKAKALLQSITGK